jgi:deoxyribodipyrimidine photo-lyase
MSSQTYPSPRPTVVVFTGDLRIHGDPALERSAQGWMPSRARMIAASFFTKTLCLDWRLVARRLFELLGDGDGVSKIGNLQGVVGTGVDTRPSRILNPMAQATRCDVGGVHVLLDGTDVHESWKVSKMPVTPDYPRPLVEHTRTSAQFRAMRALRSSGARSS